MGKRQEAAKQTRVSIIQAAERLHEKSGLSNVTVGEIVAEAGVSKGSFYVYFPRKEDIASEIAYRHFQELEEKLDSTDCDGLEKVSFFLNKSIDYILAMGLPLCKEWLKGAVSPIENDRPGLYKLNFDLRFVSNCLKKEKEKGGLKDSVSVEELSHFIVGEYYGLLSLWCITDGKLDLGERMEFFAGNLKVFLENFSTSVKK